MKTPHLHQLLETITALRNPQTGCPWDLKQTHESLLAYLIEESYEFVWATEQQDKDLMREELGDILLQVLLHAQLASEAGDFNFEDVAQSLNKKLIHRHPHVFKKNGPTPISAEQVEKNWVQLKKQEKQVSSHLDPALLRMPSMLSAYQIGKKTYAVGFDWQGPEEVFKKVEEELQELKTATNASEIEEELGDLIFTMAQLARHYKLNAEEVLRKANHKFYKRFTTMEKIISADQKELENLSRRELEGYWEKAKNATQ